MENRNYGDVIGNQSAPYLNHLANDYGLATNYHNVSNYASLPNYLALVSGNVYDSWAGCNLPPHSCTSWTPATDPTITDRIEAAGMSWRAYMEDMPGNCYQYDSAGYVPRHDPFVYVARVLNNPAECNRVVPAGPNASNLIIDLASTSTASNLMWLTPNLCDDMHDCSTSRGDQYLSQLIPQILNSPVFQTSNAALFLTWDEGSSSGHIPAIWAGPAIKSNYQSTSSYSHYSFLKTLETVWNLPPLTKNDRDASPMTDFFTVKNSFTYTPQDALDTQPLTFTGTATRGVSPFSFNWLFGDGGTASGTTVVHSYSEEGSYNVSLTTIDALNHTAKSSITIQVSGTDAAVEPASPTILGLTPIRFYVILLMVGSGGAMISLVALSTFNTSRPNRRPRKT
jgi:acid phosphatase